MSKAITGYDVGPLLYSPANLHSSIVDALVTERFPRPFSLAFCLEDTVRESAVPEAEQQLFHTLSLISHAQKTSSFYMPLIFIRIRSPKQLEKLAIEYSRFSDILTGFILPKFFIENCDAYISVIQSVTATLGFSYQYMPIFESATMIDLSTRYQNLSTVKSCLASISDQILNIRVGGNDLSHAFGLRRHVQNSIYDVKPVAHLLIDIATTFATDYVVSGPVWEYYGGPGWDTGLKRELELDMLSGFIGKTVIHPNQIPIVIDALKVSKADYEDAKLILGWDNTAGSLVASNAEATRMNEYQTHCRWASKILALASTYGIKADA